MDSKDASSVIHADAKGSVKHEPELISYGTYILVWLALLALTALTAVVAGINLMAFTVIVALLIALTKASLVVNIFMHIKFEDFIFKVFLGIAGFTLVVIFALTFADVYFRR